MERVYKVSESVSGNTGILNFIRDNIHNLGWSVIDDRISEDNYIVVYSEGHSKNNDRLPCYVKFRHHDSTRFNIDMWQYWDSSLHSGKNCFNYTNSDNSDNCGVYCDASSTNGVRIVGNKDFIYFEVYRSSNYSTDATIVNRIDNPTWDFIGTFQTSISSGTDKIIPLEPGQESNFKIGPEYRVCSPEGHIDKVRINAIDTTNHTITADQLIYTLSSGTKIGTCPFPWLSIGTMGDNEDAFGVRNDADYEYSDGTSGHFRDIDYNRGINGPTYINDWHYHNEYILTPFIYYDAGSIGSCSYVQYGRLNGGEIGDIIGINEIDVGSTHSSSTDVQIVDNNKVWVPATLSGTSVIITSGLQDGETRYVTGNDSNSFTVDPPFGTTISGNVNYALCEAMYEYISSRVRSYLFIKAI